MFWKTGCNCFPIIELMILLGKNEENTRMKKAKQCLIVLLSGVLLAITVLSGCGQSQKAVSKNDDHLTVYLWENRLMKNIVPYIHEQFPGITPMHCNIIKIQKMRFSGFLSAVYRRRLLPTRHCLNSMESRYRKTIRNIHRHASNFMIMV